MTTSLVQGLEKVAALCKSAKLDLLTRLALVNKAKNLNALPPRGSMVPVPRKIDMVKGRKPTKYLSDTVKSRTVASTEDYVRRQAANLWKQLQDEGYRFGKNGLRQYDAGGRIISPTDIEAGLRHLLATNKNYKDYSHIFNLTKNVPGFKFTSLFADLDRIARRAATASSKHKPIVRYQMPDSVKHNLTPEQLKRYNQFGILPEGPQFDELRRQIDAARPKQRPSKVNKKPGQAPETPTAPTKETKVPTKETQVPKGGADDALNKGDDALETGNEAGEGFAAIAARHPWLTMGGAGVGGGALGYALAPSRSDIESEYAQRLAATQAPTAADVKSAYGVY